MPRGLALTRSWSALSRHVSGLKSESDSQAIHDGSSKERLEGWNFADLFMMIRGGNLEERDEKMNIADNLCSMV